MAPPVDLDGWKKKNQNAAASKSKGRKRSTALGDLTVKHSKFKKEAQSSSSNSQEESNEACSDSLPPMALLVDEGGALVSKKHKEEQKEESKKVIRDDSESPPDPRDYGRSRFWEQYGGYDSDDSDDLTYDSDDLTYATSYHWDHNHEECIKSFEVDSDDSHVSPYSSPPREPNVLPYNLDDEYQLDPR